MAGKDALIIDDGIHHWDLKTPRTPCGRIVTAATSYAPPGNTGITCLACRAIAGLPITIDQAASAYADDHVPGNAADRSEPETSYFEGLRAGFAAGASYPGPVTGHVGRFERELAATRGANATTPPATARGAGPTVRTELCPTCRSMDTPRQHIVSPLDGREAAVTWCQDAWHHAITATAMHRPTIARTLNEGPGNATRIRGCSCGAVPMSAEAFAEHVGMPAAAIHTLLALVGIACDLRDYPTMDRKVVDRRLDHALTFHKHVDPVEGTR